MDWAASMTPLSTSRRGGLHQPGHEGGRGDNQGRDGGHSADGGTHQELTQGKHHDHQDQERHRAQDVDGKVEHLHHRAGQGAHAVLLPPPPG